jgi:DNA-binding transcriptional LysR family regulator
LIPEGLASHDCITPGEPLQSEIWGFPPRPGAEKLRNIRIFSRLNVNLIESAVRTAADGQGIGRVLSDQIEQEVRDGRLKVILADAEPDPIPVHLITPEGRLESAKVRVFVDFAVALLRR